MLPNFHGNAARYCNFMDDFIVRKPEKMAKLAKIYREYEER